MYIPFTTTNCNNRIFKDSNDLTFPTYYVNIIQNIIMIKMVYIKKKFNESREAKKLSLLNVIVFLAVFDWNKANTIMILIHNFSAAKNYKD